MSFQKKRTTISLPGTRKSLQYGQQLISTGNPALDHILGGGISIGSILLIEEDKYGRYSDCLTKYFLAEGVIHKHALFVGTLDVDASDVIKKLPLPVIETTSSSKSSGNSIKVLDDDMRIAWRYNNLDKVDSVQGGSNIGHCFDLSQHIDQDTISNLDITYFRVGQSAKRKNCNSSLSFTNSTYGDLLNDLANQIKCDRFSIKNNSDTEKNILRIALKAIGSPLWWDDNFADDFCRFFITLRALVRNSMAICCLTIPSHLFQHFDENLIHRIRNLVDYAIELESFAGSDKETNPAFKEYHGLLYIRKLAAVNALAAHSPETHDLAFKLRRKRFVIEKLHLPPELQESDAREGGEDAENVLSSMACGSSSKKLLDF